MRAEGGKKQRRWKKLRGRDRRVFTFRKKIAEGEQQKVV